jgi:hypothetical protein
MWYGPPYRALSAGLKVCNVERHGIVVIVMGKAAQQFGR